MAWRRKKEDAEHEEAESHDRKREKSASERSGGRAGKCVTVWYGA